MTNKFFHKLLIDPNDINNPTNKRNLKNINELSMKNITTSLKFNLQGHNNEVFHVG